MFFKTVSYECNRKYSNHPKDGPSGLAEFDFGPVAEWSSFWMQFEIRTNLSGFRTVQTNLSCFWIKRTWPFYYKEFSFYDTFIIKRSRLVVFCCPVFKWFGSHFVFTIRKPDQLVPFSNGLVAILFLPFENLTNWFGFQMAITRWPTIWKLDQLVRFS